MASSKSPQDVLREHFPTVYLTLISILVALAVEGLLERIDELPQLFVVSPSAILSWLEISIVLLIAALFKINKNTPQQGPLLSRPPAARRPGWNLSIPLPVGGDTRERSRRTPAVNDDHRVHVGYISHAFRRLRHERLCRQRS